MTNKTENIEQKTIRLNRVYRAKKPRPSIIGRHTFFNDRQVLFINEHTVQYDSPTIKRGGNYKIVTLSAFIEWAGDDVTDQLLDDEWIPYSKGNLK